MLQVINVWKWERPGIEAMIALLCIVITKHKIMLLMHATCLPTCLWLAVVIEQLAVWR